MLSVSIPDDLAAEAETLSRATGKTKSEVVRDALRRHVQYERLAELQRYGRSRAETRGVGPEDSREAARRSALKARVTPRILCDTNVLVSAFIAGGPPSRVIEATIDGRIELILADPVLHELNRILTVKLALEAKRLHEVTTLLSELASVRIEAPTTAPESITGDPDDDLILACSVDAGVHILVSGERRHLLPVSAYRGVRIITPQALLAELANA